MLSLERSRGSFDTDKRKGGNMTRDIIIRVMWPQIRECQPPLEGTETEVLSPRFLIGSIALPTS